MDSKPERLTQLSMSSLAALCQKVAEESSASGVSVDKALRLKRRWVELVSRETPPVPNFKTHEATQAELAALKSEMIELLATIF